MTVFETLNESKKNNLTEREILVNLQNQCGLKLSEALEVCKMEFSENIEKFKEAAFDLKIESLPSSGYIKDGVTVVTDEWED